MLIVHRGNRLERLADALADVVATPAGDAFAPEVVVVPGQGVARWLSLGLAARLGVCANVRFPFPAEFVWETLRAVLGSMEDSAPFEPPVLAWRVLGALDDVADEAGLPELHRYLDGADDVRRYELARRVAETFDHYLVHRPEWIEAWERGEADHWQARVWRRLAHAPGATHWVRARARFAAAVVDPDAARRLPARVGVFGVPALSPGYLGVLEAVSAHTDVHLFAHDPCREHWGEIIAPRSLGRRAGASDPEALHLESGNSLLASLGQQAREFLELVTELGAEERTWFEAPRGTCLLHRIQRDLLDLREPGLDGSVPPLPDPDDESLAVHVCHGPMREVEVLHDRLLAILERWPELGPSDIVVMTPDVERYAPYVDAVFGAAPPGQRIPYRIGDRAPGTQSRLVETFFALLALPEGRYDAESVTALLETPALRRRFDLSDGDLASIRRWVRESGIRWGIDARTRRDLDLPETDEHTWRRGLDRLVLGWALPGDAAGEQGFAGILSCDAVEGGDAAVLGRVLDFATEAFALRDALAAPRSPAAWADELALVLDRFLDPGADEEAWAQAIRRALATLAERARRAGVDRAIPLALVRAFLRETLETPRPAAGFLGGGVTVCALVPMRSIPFEVVCLLGMDDGVFPRPHRPVDFDLTSREPPRRGDRSRRMDDRHLFLETVLAARRCLHVSHVGSDPRDDAPLPPSVVVSELVDYAVRGLSEEDAALVRARLVTRHPLQPFSPRLFDGRDPRLYSHAPAFAAGARAVVSERREPFTLVAEDLPDVDVDTAEVDLDDLVAFFRNPARFLLRERLGIRLEEREGLLDTEEPFDLDGLERAVLREELANEALAGRAPGAALARLRAAGRLPHGTPGETLLRREADAALGFARRVASRVPAAGTLASVAVDVEAGGIRVTGTIEGVGAEGILEWRPVRLRGRDRLALWIRHLALNASPSPGAAPCARRIAIDAECAFPPVADAPARLASLAALFAEGRRSALPFFPEAAWAYARALAAGRGDPASAAWKQWAGNDYVGIPGERDDAYVRLAFGDTDPLGVRFATLATGIFGPVVEHAQENGA